MATSAPGSGIFLQESRNKMFELIKNHTTKEDLKIVIDNPGYKLRMALTYPEDIMVDEKVWLVVFGQPPHNVRGMILNEKEEICELYTFHIDEF